jgi:hypothetical protein
MTDRYAVAYRLPRTGFGGAGGLDNLQIGFNNLHRSGLGAAGHDSALVILAAKIKNPTLKGGVCLGCAPIHISGFREFRNRLIFVAPVPWIYTIEALLSVFPEIP